MRFRKPPRIAPRAGSIEAVDQHYESIAESARHRTLSRLRAEKASPARVAAEMVKFEKWILDWRQRAPHVAAMHGKAKP